ncbi:hypothetical protein PMZ80_010237 [Knufia obscura]|uniref:Tryptophan synthase beta chain-like PALP domain-containing protein n=2 Tax=Knufia TaxID=430999 RepID=A0AAN8F7U8_9EURO|nr:hypothetical protein PMZ80_010237 [Knufia obscura]KAK5952976.1 hypothetical protein OHC33_006097 [Knufia fluminis]
MTTTDTSAKPYTTPSGIYINPSASTATTQQIDSPASSTQRTDPAKIKAFHESLPNFNATPLHTLPHLASSLRISTLLIKTESQRLGLPAFKILGASWGVYRALCAHFQLTPDPSIFPLWRLKNIIAQERMNGAPRVVLFAATDGNHGRAVARMAGILGLDEDAWDVSRGKPDSQGHGAVIYVPSGMYETTRQLIESEGAKVVTVLGDYDCAVSACWEASQALGREVPDSGTGKDAKVGIMVQDNAFEGYEIVPGWIVEGYTTLVSEVDEQFEEILQTATDGRGREITHIVTPIGVGSLGHAVVNWAKSAERKNKVRVITVEPETAACLHASLKAGENTTIETVDTIMSGMCCGTVSPISWPALRDGVDVSVTIDDWTCHEAVLDLQGLGIESGPCGAGCLAGLRKVLGDEEARRTVGIDGGSVVVVLSTEGRREYPVPERVG